MNIAIVVNNFPRYSETFIMNLVMELLKRGHNVTVLTNNHNRIDQWYRDYMASVKEVKIVSSIHCKRGFNFVASLLLTIFLNFKKSIRLIINSRRLYGTSYKAIRAFIFALPLGINNYEIVHFQYSGLAVIYKDALPLLKPSKLVMSCRGTAEQIRPIFEEKRKRELIEVSTLIDSIHCVSKRMTCLLSNMGISSNKMFVNYPSIDTAKFVRKRPYPPKNNLPIYILSVSRMHWVKGLEYGIQAMKILKNKNINFVYTIIGDGPDEEKLRFEIHELGLENEVLILGKQQSDVVIEHLNDADIFLLTSLSEGVSNAVLEAMAMQLPIVSTNVGGMSEAISEGYNGVLCPPRDPNQIAEKILYLIDRGFEKRMAMGIAGYNLLLERFNLDKQISVFIDNYEALLK